MVKTWVTFAWINTQGTLRLRWVNYSILWFIIVVAAVIIIFTRAIYINCRKLRNCRGIQKKGKIICNSISKIVWCPLSNHIYNIVYGYKSLYIYNIVTVL